MSQNNYRGSTFDSSGKRSTDIGKGFHAVPPPALDAFRKTNKANANMPGVNKQGYTTMNAISHNAITAGMGITRKRAKTEDE